MLNHSDSRCRGADGNVGGVDAVFHGAQGTEGNVKPNRLGFAGAVLAAMYLIAFRYSWRKMHTDRTRSHICPTP